VRVLKNGQQGRSLRLDVIDLLLTLRSLRQSVATHGNGFRLFLGVLEAIGLATGRHQLQPTGGSIRAPSFVVNIGDSRGAEDGTRRMGVGAF
jgi:hypothetical protein